MSEIANIIFKETKYTLKDAKARADVVTAKNTADANKKEIDTLKEKTFDLSYQEATESLTIR